MRDQIVNARATRQIRRNNREFGKVTTRTCACVCLCARNKLGHAQETELLMSVAAGESNRLHARRSLEPMSA
eukprot:560327-Pleurochrysis_carterae.AAC.1